jgi:hypothetical protein
MNKPIVGQAPWPAADALVGLGFSTFTEPDQGSGADEASAPQKDMSRISETYTSGRTGKARHKRISHPITESARKP